MQVIRTKWHRMLELLDEGLVYTIAPSGGKATWCEDAGLDLVELRKYVAQAAEFPKFVIDHELATMATTEEFHESLLDMKAADVLHLPYPHVWVEWIGKSGAHTLTMLEDGSNYKDLPKSSYKEDEREFGTFEHMPDVGGYSITVNKDADGEYLAVSTCICWDSIKRGDDGKPWVQLNAQEAPWIHSKYKAPDLVRETHQKDATNLATSWFTIMLILGTKGVVTERIDVPKLNKQRVRQKKHAIPEHTYIRIGHVYQRDGSTKQYDERKSPRPHWRRGHKRDVPYGPRGGERKTRPVYIAPMLVAWHLNDLGPKPKVPEYIVKA